MFRLHPQLEKDTILIGDLKFCRLLLMNNNFYPWLILVPKKSALVEITDLDDDEQINLMREINLVARLMQKIFKPDKLNIAALGNIVPQLHIHIIGRFKNDSTFPRPIWSDIKVENYKPDQALEIITKIKKGLDF